MGCALEHSMPRHRLGRRLDSTGKTTTATTTTAAAVAPAAAHAGTRFVPSPQAACSLVEALKHAQARTVLAARAAAARLLLVHVERRRRVEVQHEA